MPSATVENYLKQIYLLSKESPGTVAMGRIAKRMEVVPGTATTMIKSLERAGWIDYIPRTGVELTDAGRNLALRVLRKHRIIEMFLTRVLEIDGSEINEETEMMEHAVSDKLLERINAFLGHPEVDPHGDPIPNAAGEILTRELLGLNQTKQGDNLVISRIKQQDPHFLQYVYDAGLTPGTEIKVIEKNDVADVIRLKAQGGNTFILGSKPARNILVQVTPSKS